MKNLTNQIPNPKQIPMFKSQGRPWQCHARSATRHSRWSLRFGASLVPGCWFLVLWFAPAVNAQTFTIDWFKVAGGGGTSTNAQFTLSGSIGQPDAGPTATNGQFSVTGGFWVLPQAVQTEGAPSLTIMAAARGYATISWTPNSTGYVLQETWNLSPANWTNSLSGVTNPVTVPISAGAKYFRLRKF